eukprot:gene5548-174_t
MFAIDVCIHRKLVKLLLVFVSSSSVSAPSVPPAAHCRKLETSMHIFHRARAGTGRTPAALRLIALSPSPLPSIPSPESVRAMDGVNRVVSAFDECTPVLNELLSLDLATLRSKLPPLDAAKLDLAIAYAMNSLFWVYLSARGIDPKAHPVRKELVSTLILRIRDNEKGDKRDTGQPSIDTAAAKRFIKASLENTSNTEELRDADITQSKKAKKKRHHVTQNCGSRKYRVVDEENHTNHNS